MTVEDGPGWQWVLNIVLGLLSAMTLGFAATVRRFVASRFNALSDEIAEAQRDVSELQDQSHDHDKAIALINQERAHDKEDRQLVHKKLDAIMDKVSDGRK